MDEKRTVEKENLELKSKAQLLSGENKNIFELKKEKYELEHKLIELKR